MKKYPTQEECKTAYLQMLSDWATLSREEKLNGIKRIDDMTPWSETEPKWWLEMMALQKAVIDSK
jgi:hypothetical protein